MNDEELDYQDDQYQVYQEPGPPPRPRHVLLNKLYKTLKKPLVGEVGEIEAPINDPKPRTLGEISYLYDPPHPKRAVVLVGYHPAVQLEKQLWRGTGFFRPATPQEEERLASVRAWNKAALAKFQQERAAWRNQPKGRGPEPTAPVPVKALALDD